MATKRLIYFTATELRVYRRSRSTLDSEARFDTDEAGIEAFRAFLSQHRDALLYVVADLAGEDFHEDQIPYLRGAERRTVVERRLAQRYRDTRLSAAIPLGIIKDERRNERLLLASFTNAQQFTPWLDAIAESGTHRLTRSGFTVGTSHYMSPEQVLGAADIDHRCDLYSLGCVLFECLAGRPPFWHRREELVLHMQQVEPAPDVREFRADTPASLADAIARALQKEPGQRWQSAVEMRGAVGS